MATHKQHGRSKALRPSAESLEGRQLLAGSVSGVNTAGDQWTLTVLGKGKVQVIKQPDSTGQPAALDSRTEIQSIVLSGTDPTQTRLVEKVTPAAGSSGRIYFQNLIERPNRSDRTGNALGVLAINIPHFYMADTEAAPSTTATGPRGVINIPDGINSLRFGGVDTTVSFATGAGVPLSQNGVSDQFQVRLGVPIANGTDIVVNSITSNGQAAVAASGSNTTPQPTQDSVVFVVSGRLNLFQANEIDGNTTVAPTTGGFSNGTVVTSLPDPTSGLIGQIGFVRVGGNATNFSVVTSSQIANFYVGGETNNVNVLAPTSIRDMYFGRGVDTATILTNRIENIAANRGMLNSRIVTERSIGNSTFGGDVVNSTVLAGYLQGLANVISGIESNASSAVAQGANLFTDDVTPPTPTAQAGGLITTNIAGDVTNSVFAASDSPISQVADPTLQNFGNVNDAFLPVGRITARVEGSIDNSTATPDMPSTAFYAKNVKLTRGPVAPPHVTEPPLPKPATPVTLRGIPRVFPKINGSRVAPVPRPQV